ncbi:MAG TPA: hypothetical protein VFT32_11820, partial [Candidatus Eisenbacteria bacterium]|nr:hypothetical protein [Candidatus Eisenbacteria bacterium]
MLSFVVSRAAWIRSALASIESSEPGTAARVLSGACAGFAFLTTLTLHWSFQISSLIAMATVVAGVAAGVWSSRRGPWLAVLAVPAFVLAVEFFSVASAILAGVIVVGGGTQLNHRNRLMPSALGACAGSALAILIRLLGAPAGVWVAVLAILFAARLLRPGLLIPSGAALAAFAAHAVAGFAGVFVVAFLAGGGLAADWIRRLAPRLEAHGAAIDAIPEDRRGAWIALAACAGLVIELVLIRWQSSSFQLFAYFKNATLFSAFLGLGMGYAMGPARPLLAALVLPALGLQVVLFHGLRFSGLQPVLQNPIPEQIALGMGADGSFAQAAVTYGFLLLTFAATALTCVPLGQLAGRLMRRGKPLRAYGWNLAGSLAGVLLFTGLAEFWSPPAVWFLVGGALLIPFFVFGRDAWLAAPSFLALGVALVALLEHRDPAETEVHSPYQVLVLRQQPTGPPTLTVNNVYFQNVLDLRPVSIRSSEKLRGAAAHYELPYRLKHAPGNVLVVGSGTGNDVAAALRLGAAKVDAVEIDPAILKFGALHPERPYSDPRVRAITEDARQHLRRTGDRYGLIVYGLLDSHTLLSGRSNVRLDSFVYTVEGLRDARARLAPDGVVALAFCVLTDEIARKLYLMMREAFDGASPRVFRTTYDEGMVFAAGPGLRSDVRPPEGVVDVTERVGGLTVRADVSTDDWPFLYMGRRRYPKSYLVMAAGILLLSALLVRRVLPGARIL